MSDLLISLHVPRDLAPGMVNLFIWALCVTLGLVGLFIMRLYLRAKLKKQMMAREAMAMSMMDIDSMRKRGLVSDAEYKAIRHSLAEREVEKERRRKQAEHEKAILAQAAEDPEAARQLLEASPAEPARKNAAPAPAAATPGGQIAATANGRQAGIVPPGQPQAHPIPSLGARATSPASAPAGQGAIPAANQPQTQQPQPRPASRPQHVRAALDDLEQEQARIFELSSADMVLPELLQQPEPQRPAQPKPAARPVAQQPAARPSQPAPARPAAPSSQPTASRPAAPAPAQARSAAPPPAQQPVIRPAQPAIQQQVARQVQSAAQPPKPAATSRPAAPQQPAPRPAPAAAPRRAAAPAGAGSGKPASDLDLLLQKGAITPEEYQRLKAFVQ